ncbi:unnamed protein product [Blepharisma stoltei]|uniref:Uncharacterized protein n=1 Tax=Blepharisma stoltei TaxID=1481888 RepID=A0AAU9JEP2_9CILI|nr:unnamed protein product [Blepharisma stoltei]
MAALYLSLAFIVFAKDLVFQQHMGRGRLFLPTRFGLVLVDDNGVYEDPIEDNNLNLENKGEEEVKNDYKNIDEEVLNEETIKKNDELLGKNEESNNIGNFNGTKFEISEGKEKEISDGTIETSSLEIEDSFEDKNIEEEQKNEEESPLIFQYQASNIQDESTESLNKKTEEEISEDNSLSFVILSFIGCTFLISLIYLHYKH